MTLPELRVLVAAQLQPGDTVLMIDGERTVSTISHGVPVGERQTVAITWTNGSVAVWFADGTVEAIR